jgi:sirohydrochlorin cobaltochelatase
MSHDERRLLPILRDARARADEAVLIVGHGSRDAAANAELESLVHAYAEARPDAIVSHGYVELAQPSLDVALADIASRARNVAVVPLFLFAAGHVKSDVPLALARARSAFPDVTFAAAPALGVHPSLAELAFARARTCLPEDPAALARTSVIVVGRGSSDPDANGDFCKVVRLIGEGRGLMSATPTFIGITRPRVEDTLEHVARARPERIVVVPYFLFAGRLIATLREEIATFSQRYPWIRVELAPHLGVDPALFALLDTRARQAREERETLACDACMYRTALPGFAEQVGGLKALLYSVRHGLTHTQSMPHKHAHKPITKHVLVCASTDCVDRGSLALLDTLRRIVKNAGRQREIRITRTSCMGRCGEGPTMAVYPDGVWYRGVQGADAREVAETHLFGGKLVARLVDHVMQ